MKAVFFVVNVILHLILLLVTLVITNCFPVTFGITTFFLSLLMFNKLEYDKAIHDREFYTSKPPRKSILLLINASTKVQVLIQSAALSVLSIFLFSGTNLNRILYIYFVFISLIVTGSFVLGHLERISHLNVERWGYIKVSLFLGIVFSLIISSVDGLTLIDITKQFAKNEILGLNHNEIAELTYGLLSQMNNFLEGLFSKLFGALAGKIISLILTLNTTFGFVIYIYVICYMRLLKSYKKLVEKVTGSSNKILVESYAD